MDKIDPNFVMKISQIIGEVAIENDSKEIIHLVNHFYSSSKEKIREDLPIWRD